MKRYLRIAGILALVAGLAGFFVFQCGSDRCSAFRRPIENFFKFYSLHAPCEKPITYTLRTFDGKFGLSKQVFLDAIKEAETIWEAPIGKELFAYSEDGTLTINLIYDYRQQATAKLKSLGIVVDEDNASYDELKKKYNALKAEYLQMKADYDTEIALFDQQQDAYNQEAKSWNKKGGVSKQEYDRLQEEKSALQADFTEIQKREVVLHEYTNDINSLVVVLNRLVVSLNLSVEKYNEIGVSRGEEFTEGDYQSNGSEQKINIYEFSSRSNLTRVLAHELGHALGLAHTENSKAIMYKLNTSTNEKLTPDDLKELKTRCGIQ